MAGPNDPSSQDSSDQTIQPPSVADNLSKAMPPMTPIQPSTNVNYGFNGVDFNKQQDLLDASNARDQGYGDTLINGLQRAAGQAGSLSDQALDAYKTAQDALAGLSTKMGDTAATVNDANARLLQINSMPFGAILGKLAHISGRSDFDPQFQTLRKQAAAEGLEQSANQASLLSKRADLYRQAAGFAQGIAGVQFDTAGKLAAETRATGQAKIAVASAQYDQGLRAIDSMNPMQQQAAINDPTFLSKYGMGPGDVQDAIRKRQQAVDNLAITGDALKNSDMSVQNNTRDILIKNTQETLHALPGTYLDQKFAEAQATPNKIITLDAHDINPLYPPAPVPMSADTLAIERATRQKASDEFAAARVTSLKALAEFPSALQETSTKIANLKDATGGNVSPEFAQKSITELSAAQRMGSTGDPVQISLANDMVKNLTAQTDAEHAKYVASLAKGKQDAENDYYNTRTMSTDHAVDWLTEDTKNGAPGITDKSSPLAGYDLLMNQIVANQRKSVQGIGGGVLGAGAGSSTGANSVASSILNINRFAVNDKDIYVRSTQSKEGQDAADKATAHINSYYLENGLRYLAQPQTFTGQDGKPIVRPKLPTVAGIFSNGQIAPQYQLADGSLNADKIIAMLKTADLTSNTNSVDQLQTVLNSPAFKKSTTQFLLDKYGDPRHTAYYQQLFGGDPSNAINQPNGLNVGIRKISSQVQAQIAKKNQQQAAQAIPNSQEKLRQTIKNIQAPPGDNQNGGQ